MATMTTWERSESAVASRSQEIADTVARYVRLRTGGSIRNLQVDVRDGEVLLTGRTSTYYNKQLATHAALDAAADLSLTNDIEVC